MALLQSAGLGLLEAGSRRDTPTGQAEFLALERSCLESALQRAPAAPVGAAAVRLGAGGGADFARELATRLALSYVAQCEESGCRTRLPVLTHLSAVSGLASNRAGGDRKSESKSSSASSASSALFGGEPSAEFTAEQEAWLVDNKFALWPRHPWLDAATASGRAGCLPEVPPSALIRLQSLLSS